MSLWNKSGFAILIENNRLDLSVEKIILEPKFRVLFNYEDLKVAYDRLKLHKYCGLDEIKLP